MTIKSLEQGDGDRFLGEGPDSAGCMVPILDLLNHSPDHDIAHCGFSREALGGQGAYQVQVLRDYCEGEEVRALPKHPNLQCAESAKARRVGAHHA